MKITPEGVTLEYIPGEISGTQRAYSVLLDGVRIGKVYDGTITIEKEIPGKNFVAWRRESKTRYWFYEIFGERSYHCAYGSRKQALFAMMSEYGNVQIERNRNVRVPKSPGQFGIS